jgi:N-acetylmuramoyl-L-alanine amidase
MGTIQRNINESDITLKVSKILFDLMKKDSRFKVSMTRTKDEMVSLEQRTQILSDTKSDLLVSIHVNSSPEKRARGAEFYFQNQLAPDEESLFLAHQESEGGADSLKQATYTFVDDSGASSEVKAILTDLLDGDRILRSSQLAKKLKENWTGHKKSKAYSIRQAPFFVLSQARVPSALIELGFLTNPDDFKDLTSPTAQQRMAQNIFSALIAYRESID